MMHIEQRWLKWWITKKFTAGLHLNEVSSTCADVSIVVFQCGDDDRHAVIRASVKGKPTKTPENCLSIDLLGIGKCRAESWDGRWSDTRKCAGCVHHKREISPVLQLSLQLWDCACGIGTQDPNAFHPKRRAQVIFLVQPVGDRFILPDPIRKFFKQPVFPLRSFKTYPGHVKRQAVCAEVLDCLVHCHGFCWTQFLRMIIHPFAEITALILRFIPWAQNQDKPDNDDQQRTHEKNAFAACLHGVAILKDRIDWASGH